MTFLDGEDGKVVLKMYRGEALGLSFPTDGNRHYDEWAETVVNRGPYKITIRYHKDAPEDLIAIEVDLPDSIKDLEVYSR